MEIEHASHGICQLYLECHNHHDDDDNNNNNKHSTRVRCMQGNLYQSCATYPNKVFVQKGSNGLFTKRSQFNSIIIIARDGSIGIDVDRLRENSFGEETNEYDHGEESQRDHCERYPERVLACHVGVLSNTIGVRLQIGECFVRELVGLFQELVTTKKEEGKYETKRNFQNKQLTSLSFLTI